VEKLSTSDINYLGQKLDCKFRSVPGPGVFGRQHIVPESPGPKSEGKYILPEIKMDCLCHNRIVQAKHSLVYSFAFDSAILHAYDSIDLVPSQQFRTCKMNDKSEFYTKRARPSKVRGNTNRWPDSIKFARISVYIHENPSIKCNTIIVEYHDPKGITQSLEILWQADGHERWHRLRSKPIWVFCDMFNVFGWGPILRELSSELRAAVSIS